MARERNRSSLRGGELKEGGRSTPPFHCARDNLDRRSGLPRALTIVCRDQTDSRVSRRRLIASCPGNDGGFKSSPSPPPRPGTWRGSIKDGKGRHTRPERGVSRTATFACRREGQLHSMDRPRHSRRKARNYNKEIPIDPLAPGQRNAM